MGLEDGTSLRGDVRGKWGIQLTQLDRILAEGEARGTRHHLGDDEG